MHKLESVLSIVDDINDKTGRVIALLLAPLVGVIVYEVVMRYVFNSPTIWVHETSNYLFGAIFALGGAYALRHGAHVNVDILHVRLSLRAKAIVDLVTSSIFFLFIGIMLWKGVELAWISLKVLEKSHTVWGPPVYPMKILVPMAAFLILLQGMAKFIRDILTTVTGKVISVPPKEIEGSSYEH